MEMLIPLKNGLEKRVLLIAGLPRFYNLAGILFKLLPKIYSVTSFPF
jgi:hypothetical protein